MVLPKQPDQNSTPPMKRRGNNTSFRNIIMLAICGGCAFGVVFSILRPTGRVLKDQNVIDSNLRNVNENAFLQSKRVEPTELTHEELFHDTLRDCVPNVDDAPIKKQGQATKKAKQKCNEYLPKDGIFEYREDHVQRVAIITPPGQMGNLLYKQIQRIIAQHDYLQAKIELVHTSHVPPYGYGNTHGLTKIIRLISHPIVSGVVDALQSTLESQETQQDITINDLKAVLRQLLRFHCRLSHVSAHTAILTIDLQKLIDNNEEISAKIHDFLVYHGDKANLHNTQQEQDADLIQSNQRMVRANDDEVNILTNEFDFISTMLTRIQVSNHNNEENIFSTLDDVLMEELEETNHLLDWPCKSFWTVGEKPNPAEGLSKFTTRLARSFVPNCTLSYNSCFVKLDSCEANGKAVCS